MDTFKRWVLLEHVGDPNDPEGRHFDLLLEDRSECRSWQLRQIPILDGLNLHFSTCFKKSFING